MVVKNPRVTYNMNSTALEDLKMERDLGVAGAKNLKPSDHVDSVVLKANRMLGMIYRTVEVHKKGYVWRSGKRPLWEFLKFYRRRDFMFIH